MEADLIRGCVRIIENQNIIISNLQKSVDEYKEEKNRQKMKNRMRVEKSKLKKKKKEQCDNLEGEGVMVEEINEVGDGGEKKKAEAKEDEERMGKRGQRSGEGKRKIDEKTTGQKGELHKMKKKKKKSKTGVVAAPQDITQEDMIGIGAGGNMIFSGENKVGNEGSQVMEWWAQPRGQSLTQIISPPEGGNTIENGNGGYNSNDNNNGSNIILNNNIGSGNDNNGYKDYFGNHSNLYTQLGGIQLDSKAIEKIIEGGIQ